MNKLQNYNIYIIYKMESSRIPFSTRAKNLTVNSIRGLNFDDIATDTLIKKVDANNAGNSNIKSSFTANGSVTTLISGDPDNLIPTIGGEIITSIDGAEKQIELTVGSGLTKRSIIIQENQPVVIEDDLSVVNLSVTNSITGTSIVASGAMGANTLSVTNGITTNEISATGLIQSNELYASTITATGNPITQNFDIITAATWTNYHLIPMFHTTSTGSIYTGDARKLSFTRDDNSRYSLRYKPVDSTYGGYGTLYTNTFAGFTFASLSDNRLKHNEKKIKNGLDVIRRIEPQEYQKTGEMLAPDYNGDISGEWHYEAGFIAQEIKQIPEISYSVLGGDTIKETGEIVPEPYSVNYNNIFTYAVAGLKELDAIVTTQASLIEKLEARLVALENK